MDSSTALESLTDLTTMTGQIFWMVAFFVALIAGALAESRPVRPPRYRTPAEDAERESFLRSYQYKTPSHPSNPE